MTQSKISAPEFTQAEIDTAWEDVLRQQASIIKSKEAEITALKSRCDSICRRLGIALEANVDEAIAEHTALKAVIENLKIELEESLEETRNYAMVGNELHALVLPNDESDEPSLSDLFPAIKAMKAEIERLRDPWQPIETAPHGKEILLLKLWEHPRYPDKYNGCCITVGRYVTEYLCPICNTYEGCDHEVEEDDMVSTRILKSTWTLEDLSRFNFTHWCELPPVPQAQAQIEEIPNDNY